MTRLLAAILAAVGVLALAPLVGPPLEGEAGAFILRELRIPRVLVGALVGATLSVTGLAYQSLFANPLAVPSSIGTTAGATLGALAAIILGARTHALGLPLVVVAAFVGALVVSALASGVAASRRARVEDIVLAGIACSLAASALATGLQLTADTAALMAAAQWSHGHLPQVGYGGALLLAPFALVTVGVLASLARALEVLGSGEEYAFSLGVNVRAVRALTIGVGALGVAACVAWCGPIAFVEILVPPLVRKAVGDRRRLLFPLTALLGAAFLVLCDTLARTAWPGREIPVGAVTAALGAPALVVLMARDRGR